jgi:hypothetical protein
MGDAQLLLTGGITIRSINGRNASSATNSVFAIAKDGRILGRYDKAHLVPYGEYLPARPILSSIGLSRLAPGDLDFDPGPGPQTRALPLVGKAGFQLCYEIIFSGEVVERANRPAFLFNPSNDAWFGAWGPPQHLAQGPAAGAGGGAARAPLDTDRDFRSGRCGGPPACQPALAHCWRDRHAAARPQAAHAVRPLRQSPAVRLCAAAGRCRAGRRPVAGRRKPS